MEALLGLAGFAFFVWAVARTGKRPLQLSAGAQELGHQQYLRSGEYPSSCSWCKNTALARKLFLFERRDTWRAVDVMSLLSSCPPHDVAPLSQALAADQPRWRRFCTERCAKEFLTAEQVPMAEPFASCEYCSCRIPNALLRCNHCGAPRK